jgi:hypothetical protein
MGAKCKRLDLDGLFVDWRARYPARFAPGGPNPVLDPAVFSELLEEAHEAAGVRWSYGGYLEDRRHILAGSYLDATRSYLHLGVDFNVPEGTPVVPSTPSKVMLVDDDADRNGGWGPRVFLRRAVEGRPDVVAIFAHLRAPRCRPGDELLPAQPFAVVGGPPSNGNWHPHLHVQLVRGDLFREMLLDRFQELDGYGHLSHRERLAIDFPDPLKGW